MPAAEALLAPEELEVAALVAPDLQARQELREPLTPAAVVGDQEKIQQVKLAATAAPAS